MRILTKDRAFALAMLGVVAVMFLESRNIRPPTRWQPYGSAFFPQLLLGVLGVLAAVLLIRSIVRPAPGETPVLPEVTRFLRDNQRIVGLFALFGAYVALMPALGYVVATVAFLVVSFLMLGAFGTTRRGVAAGVLAVIVPVLVLLVFENVLSIRLP